MGFLEDWRAAEVDQMELQQLLLHHYGRSTLSEREVTYERDGRAALTLSYTVAGALIRITTHHGFLPQDAESIRSSILSSLLGGAPDSFGVRTIFAHQPITGHYACRDRFWIVPMPPEAPRPPHLTGKHPGRLVARIKGSPDVMTRSIRASIELRKLELILSLLIPSIDEVEGGVGREEWVYGNIVDGEITSEYRQVGYDFPGRGSIEPIGLIKGIEPLKLIPSAEYYSRPQGIRVHEDMLIPDNLDASLDQVFGLGAEDQEKLLRACYWLHAARKIHSGSMSSSFIALVSAVEALLPNIKDQNCEICGKPQGPGPTAQFKAFVEQHLPDALTNKRKSQFYQIRSDLVHGGKLMLKDHIGWGLSHKTADESGLFAEISIVARMTVYTWLWRTAKLAE